MDLFDRKDVERHQRPVSGPPPTTYGAGLAIAMHPAFRIGFLDAQRGHPLDHDRIRSRIYCETPRGALQRLGYARRDLSERDIEIAQYRYEEGRTAVIQFGLRCKAWGHPDFPPVQVDAFIREWVKRPVSPAPPAQGGR